MKYDIQAIKEKLSYDNIISIMDSLFDCPAVKENQNEIIFPSVCHHRDDWQEHGKKLYFYKRQKTFYCYSCQFHGDIFSLVQHINHCDFKQSVETVCRLADIDIATIGNTDIDNWKSLKRFLPEKEYEQDEPLVKYEQIEFEHLYHESWLKDGIGKDVMDKFGIGWYARQQVITIPVKDIDGNLVGIRGRFTREYDTQRGKYRPLMTLNEQYKFPTGKTLYGIFENKSAISKSKSVIIFEAEKSTLQCATFGTNTATSCFGHNITKSQIKLLIGLGVTEVTIGFDADYHRIGDEEWKVYVSIVKKSIQKLRPYFANIYVLYDKWGLLGYKDSPTDRGKEVFDKLYKNRLKVS